MAASVYKHSAKAPTEKHSFDEKKSLFTDDDVQRLAMAVKNLMLDDLRGRVFRGHGDVR
jgi:hypothetical protein